MYYWLDSDNRPAYLWDLNAQSALTGTFVHLERHNSEELKSSLTLFEDVTVLMYSIISIRPKKVVWLSSTTHP